MAPAAWARLACASAGIFLALAFAAYLFGLLPGERGLYDTILAGASPGVVWVFRRLNYLGDKQILLPATLLLLAVAPRDARRRWWLWVGVMVAAPSLEGLAKEVIGRPRPTANAAGFPSGHVTAAAAYFFLGAYLAGKRLSETGRLIVLWLASAIVVALVGVARIVLQAHWPADALGGAALGLACVAVAAWWHERATRPPPPA